MHVTWLGWAGFECEHDGATLVVDPLLEPSALYAALGDAAAHAPLPPVLAAPGARSAVGGLITHLHRDHADAAALTHALAPGAPALVPAAAPRDDSPGLAQAAHELAAAGLTLAPVAVWEQRSVGPFTITALPAVDGTGEPQVSWAIEAGGRRVVHCGDTIFHGSWWHMATLGCPVDLALLPVNGAVVSFPWRRPASPLPAVMTPEEAACAGQLLGAARVMPMHFDGFDLEPYYRPLPEALPRFLAAAEERGLTAISPRRGEAFEVVGHDAEGQPATLGA